MVSDLAVKIAGVVPDPEAGFDADRVAPPKEQRKMDRFMLFALAAADEAVAQAGWQPRQTHELERTATVIASGVGGFAAIAEAVRTTDTRGVRRLSPFTVPSFLVNLAAGHVSIRYGYRGPIGAPVTACAAGVQAIGDAARMIRADEADVVICGGAEACINEVSLGGFAAARALSTAFNATPTRASRRIDDRTVICSKGDVRARSCGVVVVYPKARIALPAEAVPRAAAVCAVWTDADDQGEAQRREGLLVEVP
jgi:3-oxoacyl-[acyl-carrier-protein] synthase II